MNTEHLKCVLAVARCGSMNRAAKALFLTQPTVSASISAVENELGYPLFRRTKNGSELTEAGARVAEEIAIVLHYIDSWVGLAQQAPPANVYFINNSELGFSNYLRSAIVDFRHMYSNINVFSTRNIHIFTDENATSANLLILPLVSTEPFDRLVSEEWDSYELFSDKLIAYISADNPLSELPVLRLSELNGTSIALPMSDEPLEPSVFWKLAGERNQVLRLVDDETVLEAARSSHVVGILTSACQKNNLQVQSGAIVTRPIADANVTIAHRLFSRKGYHLSAAEKIFRGFLISQFDRGTGTE